jgi:hypothetical protein
LRCGQRTGKRHLKAWLCMGKCNPLQHARAEGMWTQEVRRPAIIGTRLTHASHNLIWKRGVWVCVNCGSYAKASEGHKSTCLGLTAACTKHPSTSGQAVLDRLVQGLTPRPGLKWPLPIPGPVEPEAMRLDLLWPDSRGKLKRSFHQVNSRKVPKMEPQPDGSQGSAQVRKRGRSACAEGATQGCIEFMDTLQDEDPWGDQADFEM